MSNKVSEYEMLREEILQYLEEYQSVRNMMYAITVTILGIACNAKCHCLYVSISPYCYFTIIYYSNRLLERCC